MKDSESPLSRGTRVNTFIHTCTTGHLTRNREGERTWPQLKPTCQLTYYLVFFFALTFTFT
jgi:hypothetical protein